jgi:4-amino-4-deoxy-L-arabinose transferase-like glycosyltransferase
MKHYLRYKLKEKYATYVLFAILLFAAALRLYGINWDQNQHLHPDERFLTMVTQAIKWPSSTNEYLNSSTSPLNPYNAGFGFFVYGTLPLKIVKLFSEFIKFEPYEYNNIAIVGRFISTLFDLGVVFLVYKIAKKIFNKKTALFSAFLYSISVLPIQLAHFYVVDTFLVFFITFNFYFLILLIKSKRTLLYSILIGISFGFAIASKISAILLLPITILGYIFLLIKQIVSKKKILSSSLPKFLGCIFAFLFSSYIILRFADPHIFTSDTLFRPNPQYIDNIKQLKIYDHSETFFPPAIQWIKTKPIIFPLKNIVLWGLGLSLGILSITGVVYSSLNTLKSLKQIKKPAYRQAMLSDQRIFMILMLMWIIGLFSYQGIQFGKTMRYFYPIYPFLAILSANFLYKVVFNRINSSLLLVTCYLLLTIWPLSFIQIYSRPHSRVQASEWIYENIPQGSTLSCEHWDDCLPLPLDGKSSKYYKIEILEMFNPDDSMKWERINRQLKDVDYLILSSNRVWGSTTKVPIKYPMTSRFYHNLFEEKLQFKKVVEITSYPTIPILGVSIPDYSSEEAFTVYDHPRVLIFKSL